MNLVLEIGAVITGSGMGHFTMIFLVVLPWRTM